MTPGRIVLFIVLIGSAAVAAYGLFFDRTGDSILLTVVGLAILGITLAVIAIRLASYAVKAGWAGRGGRSIGSALLGGLFALAASGTLSAALILGLIIRPV